MSRQDTSLSSELWNKIEVIILVIGIVLNNIGVDDATRWWVYQLSISIFNEESLCDSLVHNNNSDVWSCATLVVDIIDSLLELLNFVLDNLLSHGISNTISEDDEVLWLLIILRFIGLDSIDE